LAWTGAAHREHRAHDVELPAAQHERSTCSVPFGTRRHSRANASTRLHPGAGRPDRSSGSAVTAAFGPGRLIRPGRALWGLQGAIRHW
jgi:hypothetical protein